jgi:hypothetical protein
MLIFLEDFKLDTIALFDRYGFKLHQRRRGSKMIFTKFL